METGRYTEETDLPWDYQRIIPDRLKSEMKLPGVDTGGGGGVSDQYGIVQGNLASAGADPLPFDDAAFDMFINRYGDFNYRPAK